MAENLLKLWPRLTKQDERDMEFAMDGPFCPLWDREVVLRAVDELPGAYDVADKLRRL
jgi:hypothetical protein